MNFFVRVLPNPASPASPVVVSVTALAVRGQIFASRVRPRAPGRNLTLLGFLLVFLFLSQVGFAADLNPLERELRGFLRTVDRLTAKADLPVSGRFERSTRFSTTTLDSAKARVEITSEGEVRYSVGFLGSRVGASASDIDSWIGAGTALDSVGFTVGDGFVDVGVRPSEYARESPGRKGIQIAPIVTIRVYLSEKMTCVAAASALGVVLDLGDALQRLLELERQLAALTTAIEVGKRNLARADNLGGHASRGLKELLIEAIENRKAYGVLVQAEPAALRTLEQEFEEIRRRELAIDVEIDEVASGLVALAGSPPGEGSSYEDLAVWAGSLKAATTTLLHGYAKCAALGCEGRESTVAEWKGANLLLEKFEAGMRRSVAERCGASEPMSRAQLEDALAIPAPDQLIARKILRCGISFPADDRVLTTVKKAGLFRETEKALRAEGVYRPTTAEIRDRVVRACARSLAEIRARKAAPGEGLLENAALVTDAGEIPVISQGSLFWTGSSLGRMAWIDGNSRCEGLTLGGHSWRLPTIEELEAFFRSGEVGLLNSRAKVQVVGCCIWSGTARGSGAIIAFDVEGGERDRMSRRLGLASVLCVSSRPTGPP